MRLALDWSNMFETWEQKLPPRRPAAIGCKRAPAQTAIAPSDLNAFRRKFLVTVENVAAHSIECHGHGAALEQREIISKTQGEHCRERSCEATPTFQYPCATGVVPSCVSGTFPPRSIQLRSQTCSASAQAAPVLKWQRGKWLRWQIPKSTKCGT